MSIIVNFRNKQCKNNIKNNFIHKDSFEIKIMIYNNKEYIFFDLKNYEEIILECDTNTDENISVECIKNGNNKYIMFTDDTDNICVCCDNFRKICIINHYYSYKWGPNRSNMNSQLCNEKEIDDSDFDNIKDNILELYIE